MTPDIQYWERELGYTKKEKRDIYCLLSCRTRLGTILIPYQWKGNSYTSSSSQERTRRYSGVNYYRFGFVVRTITIIYNNQQQQKNEKKRGKECYRLLYSSHLPTILYTIYTTKRQHEYHQCIVPVYVSIHLTINKQEYIAAWQYDKRIVPIYIYICILATTTTYKYVTAYDESVVIILVGKDGHRHDNKFNKKADIIEHHYYRHTNPLLSTYQPYHTEQSTAAEGEEGEKQHVCTVPIVQTYSI